MKLLIVTQTVDRRDPILGFFHGWIEEFAKLCDSILVIGQSTGSYDLPSNVKVISLEKEKGRGKIAQIVRFWKLIWRHRKSYDSVFVHMTPIWIVLGACTWKFLSKPMYLWYEIKRGSWKLTTALLVVRNVFAASEHGLPSISKKQLITGHGIDTKKFVPDASKREAGHLVSVGRITSVKQYDRILKILADLPEETRLTIAGGTITDRDKETEKNLREQIHRLNLADRTEIGWVAPEDMPSLLQRADVFVHAAQGGLDKVALQAMACGVPVVTSSEAARDALPSKYRFGSVSEVMRLPADEREVLGTELRSIIETEHELGQCIANIVSGMQK